MKKKKYGAAASAAGMHYCICAQAVLADKYPNGQ